MPLNRYVFMFFLIANGNVQAQPSNEIIISGIVIDKTSGDRLERASVGMINQSFGTISDDAGQFILKIPEQYKYDTLIISHLGFKNYKRVISEIQDVSNLTVELTHEVTLLKEVPVYSEIMAKRYFPKELKEDYVKFYTILEKVHTGLYDYVSEAQWRVMKDSSLQLLREPMIHRDFFQLIAWHVAKIRNVHTRHGVTNAWIRKKSDIFPFNLSYIKNRLYVAESLSDHVSLPKGTEILEINGRTPREIKSIIWPYIPADGYIETHKTAIINDYFSWFYALFVEEPKQFTITYRTLQGVTETISTPGFKESFRHLGFTLRARYAKSPLELKIEQKLDLAYFRIEDSRLFKDSLYLYFEKINKANVKNLVIDLRGHGGLREESHVTQLFSYLVNKPFRVYERTEVKSNDYSVFDKDFTFRPYANTLAKIKREYFEKLTTSGKGYFLWEKDPCMGIIQPASIHFSGKIYILADGRNHSASTDFTSVASTLDNVWVVGEETGGEYRSYVSGAIFSLVLPNSKIGVKVPTWKSILAIKENPSQRGRGVIPDFPVSQPLAHFIKGRDTVKEFVYDLISQDANNKNYE